LGVSVRAGPVGWGVGLTKTVRKSVTKLRRSGKIPEERDESNYVRHKANLAPHQDTNKWGRIGEPVKEVERTEHHGWKRKWGTNQKHTHTPEVGTL